ncbi:MAG: succinyl-diaminopimelate desuccinylase [Pseudomonadota bacterium]
MTKPNLSADPVLHAQKLIQCKSITPIEGGALTYLEDILSKAGFACHRLSFCDNETPDVENLYARIGTQPPHLCFAGHTDVVPPGEERDWTFPPFAGQIELETLYGRGAVDMKGGIAAFLAATLEILQNQEKSNQSFKGSLSFLITGDEEGPAINGTQKLLTWMKSHNEMIDHCLVGEPTNPEYLGDMIKIGRRGSLNGTLSIKGKQGHVAYPDKAQNPVDSLLAVLTAFKAKPLDQGNAHFTPSHLEITSVDVGNPVTNVIPAQAVAKFNIRYNTLHTLESLKNHLRTIASDILAPRNINYNFRFHKPSECFLTEPAAFSDLLVSSIQAVTGKTPELSTSGGTSDARFIKDYCPVIEFGLVNETIHQIDERVPVQDLKALKEIYKTFIEKYFSAHNP